MGYCLGKMIFKGKDEFFKKGVNCTANFNAITILPDGNVSICGRFYWIPEFLIGDVNDQTIMQVWNSTKALNLWNRKRERKKQNYKTSSCYSCKEFDYCIDASKVCWSEIVDSYGLINWDYPDPWCPDAHPTEKEIYMTDKVSFNKS